MMTSPALGDGDRRRRLTLILSGLLMVMKLEAPPKAPPVEPLTGTYLLHLPQPEPAGPYPLVIALSPGADARGMIAFWAPLADRNGFAVYASATFRNGIRIDQLLYDIAADVDRIAQEHPIDRRRIIASGISGGAMGSHDLDAVHPELLAGLILNTGMRDESLRVSPQTRTPPKTAVFLASPQDFRYREMTTNRAELADAGWRTVWLEFQGGHRLAPPELYQTAWTALWAP